MNVPRPIFLCTVGTGSRNWLDANQQGLLVGFRGSSVLSRSRSAWLGSRHSVSRVFCLATTMRLR